MHKVLNRVWNISPFFDCKIGVRQGANLPPFLFALYLNHPEQYLLQTDVTGLKYVSDQMEHDLHIFLSYMIQHEWQKRIRIFSFTVRGELGRYLLEIVKWE